MTRNATVDPKARTLTTTTGTWRLARHDTRPDGDVDAVVSLVPHLPDAASTRRVPRWFGYRYTDGRWWQVSGLWGTCPDARRMISVAARQYTVAWPALCDLLNLALVVPAADEVEEVEAA